MIGDMVEQQLIETFVDGENNDQLKLKILKDRPNTLQWGHKHSVQRTKLKG